VSILAAIQMASSPQLQTNLDDAGQRLSEAADRGARLAVLPENFAFLGAQEKDKLPLAETFGQGKIQDFLATQAQKHGLWLVGGTIPLKSSVAGKVYASCLIFNPEGECVGRYDKIHLFDVEIPNTGERYEESATICPGDSSLVLDTPFGRLGVIICYDLRFPELARLLLSQGMEILALPAAFTAITGKAHWEILVRARAIENLCYVVAAAQGGFHVSGRSTYGHSIIVDPWGNILAQQASGSGVVIAKAERSFLEQTRRHFPAIDHRHLDCQFRLE
jgi:nitrilase